MTFADGRPDDTARMIAWLTSLQKLVITETFQWYIFTQNLFYEMKHTRTLSLNSHYIVLFKYARDASQVANMARQINPGKSAFMIEAFRNATTAPYGYPLMDPKQETDDKLKLRTGISPGDVWHVYLRK